MNHENATWRYRARSLPPRDRQPARWSTRTTASEAGRRGQCEGCFSELQTLHGASKYSNLCFFWWVFLNWWGNSKQNSKICIFVCEINNTQNKQHSHCVEKLSFPRGCCDCLRLQPSFVARSDGCSAVFCLELDKIRETYTQLCTPENTATYCSLINGIVINVISFLFFLIKQFIIMLTN